VKSDDPKTYSPPPPSPNPNQINKKEIREETTLEIDQMMYRQFDGWKRVKTENQEDIHQPSPCYSMTSRENKGLVRTVTNKNDPEWKLWGRLFKGGFNLIFKANFLTACLQIWKYFFRDLV
jgi:hypothetical protein